LQPLEQSRQLNDTLLESIDETITALLSHEVVEALYAHLQTVHSISKSEVAYRLDTLSSILEGVFGVRGSRTIHKAIARKFYGKLDFEFFDHPDRTLIEYVEMAREKVKNSIEE
jgi:hypothetical protein